jgi:SNF family Na+-dependent transporter
MDVILSILVVLGSKLLTYAAIALFSLLAPLISTIVSALEALVIILIVVYSSDEDDEKKEGKQPPASK